MVFRSIHRYYLRGAVAVGRKLPSVVPPRELVTASRPRSRRLTQVIEACAGTQATGSSVQLVMGPGDIDGENADVASLGRFPQHALC